MVLLLHTRARKAITALLAAAATLALGLSLFAYYRADRFSRQGGTRETLERAIALQPGNAEFHHRLGQVLLYSPLGDPAKAMAELERAVALDPRTGAYWVDLALAQELEGDAAGATRALERARQAEPHTPAILWHQANFWLRRGETAQALDTLRELLSQAPEYTGRALPVFARVTDLGSLIEQAVPPRSDAMAAVLEFLRRQETAVGAEAAWERVLKLGGTSDTVGVRPFMDWLIAVGEFRLAQRVWADAARKGWIPVESASLDQPLYNGDFHQAPMNFGFDWRVLPYPEASVWIEAGGPQPGQQSLCVQFSESARAEYAHLIHYVPVEPNRRYALRAAIRSEQLFSRVGAYLQVLGYLAASAPLASTEAVVGTSNWKQLSLELETGPQTRMVELALLRPAASANETPVSGVVCVAGVEWKALGPAKRLNGSRAAL
jgi:tetratricopeptide (TPR) repeat protein